MDLDPLHSHSWQALGEIELFVGQLDQAAADTRKALELSPDVWPGPIALSKIYVILGPAKRSIASNRVNTI